MINLELDRRRVVVTGGASNIGRGIVHALASQHAQIVIIDIDEEKAKATRLEALEQGASDCLVRLADLSEPESGSAVIRDIVDELGPIDVLVNNFGWGDPGLLLTTNSEQWDRLWRLNLGATIGCSHAALANMKDRRRGAIVNIASDAAQGVPNQSVYGAMKAGVVTFTRAIAREFGRYGIRANVVAPGLVYPDPDSTGEHSVWNRGSPVLSETQIEQTLQASALRRRTRPDDIANAVLFLASETVARQVTGQLISVGGGWWMP